MTEAFIHSTELKKAQKVIADLQMRFEEYKNMRTTDAEKRLEEYKKISSAKYNALSNELDSHRDKYIFSSSELQKTLLVCKNQAVELQNSQKEISKLRERLNTLESNQKVFSGDVQVATTNSFTEKLEGNALEDLRKAQDESKHLAQKLKSSTKSYDKLNSEYIRWKENSEAESKKLKEALDAKSKALEKSESIVKDLKAEVVTLQSKLTSIQNRARSEVSERPAMPDRYVQMIESMLRMYEELTHIHIQSVEETRCEIDSDDEEDERSGDVDEIDHARRKSVRRQTIGVFQKGCGIEDALRYTFEQKGKIGGFITCWMIQADRMTDIKFSLTVSKEQTADSSKNVLYSLHSAKDVRGVEFEEDSDELPEYLNGEMTFPRERLADFFRKTSGWLFSA
ncbi:hypothetical protein HDU83_004892 [Entophlyctis luteolus]|nr:hypothetical protein HDU83_004892 [Entophlyctis luteolus]